MSSLSASFNSFQSEFQGATSRNAQHIKRTGGAAAAAPQASVSTPSSRPSTPSAAPNTSDLKRKRPNLADSSSFSQPVDRGNGTQITTQITYAVNYLRSKDRPVTYDDIWNYLSLPTNLHNHYPLLRYALKDHPKVAYDPQGLDGQPSFRYRPTHDVRSAEELEAYLQRQTTAKGIDVKNLKDGWDAAIPEIDRMEANGQLLVLRNKKDNTPKYVWSNDPSLALHIDDDFKDYWNKIKLPANPDDMRLELEKAGLTPTSQVKEPVNPTGSREKKKRQSRKVGRTTNTHIQLKEYPQKS